MRYFSLWAIAALAWTAAGCRPWSPGSADKGAVCPHCGKRHITASTDASMGASAAGLELAASGDAAPNYADDYGPAQVFEVRHVDGAAIRIGRVWPSCTCLQVVSGSGAHEAGQPAKIVVRQVEANATGQVILYVQTLSPASAILSLPVSVKQ